AVAARILDKDGGQSEYTTTVVVTNVAPTARLSNNGPVNEGSPATVSFTHQFDPSSADTAAGFQYAYACDGATYGTVSSNPSANCTFTDNGSYTVAGQIRDKDGGFTEYTTTVVVTN